MAEQRVVYGRLADHTWIGGKGDPEAELEITVQVNRESDFDALPLDSIVAISVVHAPEDQRTILFKCEACDQWERRANEFDGQALVANAKEFDLHERTEHMPDGACYSMAVQ